MHAVRNSYDGNEAGVRVVCSASVKYESEHTELLNHRDVTVLHEHRFQP